MGDTMRTPREQEQVLRASVQREPDAPRLTTREMALPLEARREMWLLAPRENRERERSSENNFAFRSVTRNGRFVDSMREVYLLGSRTRPDKPLGLIVRGLRGWYWDQVPDYQTRDKIALARMMQAASTRAGQKVLGLKPAPLRARTAQAAPRSQARVKTHITDMGGSLGTFQASDLE
jgi:hypothetical protein